jgi:hypothetical protein
MRLLPRLPTLFVLQDVINGLVTRAAEMMTTQGRRPELVRWTWQRDMLHRFLYREQWMRFFVDGVLALCILAQQRDSHELDQWYGVFLLSTELDDQRLMRLRLERLLCWRGSPERWACYRHILPVLILARTQRQRDHWQRAIEASVLKLSLDPLAGALACVPPEKTIHMHPWLLSWRTLATEVSCHLKALLKPLPRAAFPLSLQLDEEIFDAQSPSHISIDAVSSHVSARLSRLVVGGMANRAVQVTQDGLEEREVIALLGLRLNACQWSILHLLLAHPLLSDEELAGMLGLQRKSVRCALYELHQRGCLEPVVTEMGKRWHLSGHGLRLMAAANHVHVRSCPGRTGKHGNIRNDTARSSVALTAYPAHRGNLWLLC